MAKQNCWECKKCGRQPGGPNAHTLGVCPAAAERRADGINGGANGGRCCWLVAGTMCGGRVQGTFAVKLKNCWQCDFYQKVVREEGREFVRTREALEKIRRR